jgi:hypothetical protein
VALLPLVASVLPVPIRTQVPSISAAVPTSAATELGQSHVRGASPRAHRMARISAEISARSARISRTEREPNWRFFPFNAAWVFPAVVRGPVECLHGWERTAASLSRSRPFGVKGPRFPRLTLPAATRLGLGSFC